MLISYRSASEVIGCIWFILWRIWISIEKEANKQSYVQNISWRRQNNNPERNILIWKWKCVYLALHIVIADTLDLWKIWYCASFSSHIRNMSLLWSCGKHKNMHTSENFVNSRRSGDTGIRFRPTIKFYLLGKQQRLILKEFGLQVNVTRFNKSCEYMVKFNNLPA